MKLELLKNSKKSECLYLYDLDTMYLIKNIPKYETYFGLQRLQLTQAGTKAICYNDSEILVTNLQSGEVQRTLKSSFLGSRSDCANVFTQDAEHVLAVCFDKILRIYKYQPVEIEDKKESDHFTNEKINGVYPGEDGRHLVTTSMGPTGQTLSVWDVTSSDVVRRLRCSNIGVNEVRMLGATPSISKDLH